MTTYNTGNAIGSTDARDLYDNAQALDQLVNGSALSYSDRRGSTRRSLAGIDAAADNVLNSIGYAVPVAYASGISLTLTSHTVEYNGEIYAPKSSALPFTTSSWGTDSGKFRLMIASDASRVNYKPAGTGTVVMPVQEKLDQQKTAMDWGHVIDPGSTTYPYNPNIPVDVLRGTASEKFALTLAKTLEFTDTPNFKLNARAKKAFSIGVVRVTVVGDSITAGADNWRSNNYVSLLKVRLQQTFPWVKFQFSNLAIGGMSSGTLNSDSYVGAASRDLYVPSQNFWMPRSFGGVNTNDTLAPTGYALLDEDNWPMGSTAGKTWKQHVVDSDPDIIVWAFGMNDGTDFDTFLENYGNFQSYIKAQIPSATPWFVLVSCFLPDKIPPNGQPHAAWQLPAQCIADQVKYLAKRDNYGLIDANAMFNLLRDGIRHDYAPYTHEFNWRYGADSNKWYFQPGFALDSGNSYASGTGMAVRKIATRDIDFSATFQVSAFSSNYFVGRIHYRGTNEVAGSATGYSVDVVLSSVSQNANITVYYKNQSIASAAYDQGAIPLVGHQVALKVKVHGDHHEIWLADLLILTFTDCRTFYRGTVQVGIPQGAGYVSGLGLSYTGLNVEGPVDFDRKWLLGTPIYNGNTFVAYGDFISNPDSMGGNVVNHPTAWGHNTYYAFGVMRFVNELKHRINQPINVTVIGTTPFTLTAAENTPQKVSNIAPIYISLRKATKIRITINMAFSVGNQVAFVQAGAFINDAWAVSSYLPSSDQLGGAGMRMATLTFSKDFSAGNHIIEMGAVRNSTGETYRVGEAGTTYSMTATELDDQG